MNNLVLQTLRCYRGGLTAQKIVDCCFRKLTERKVYVQLVELIKAGVVRRDPITGKCKISVAPIQNRPKAPKPMQPQKDPGEYPKHRNKQTVRRWI